MQQARRQGSRLRPPNAPPASCKHACVSWSTRPILEEGPAPGANRADGRNWPQRDAAHARPSHGKDLTMQTVHTQRMDRNIAAQYILGEHDCASGRGNAGRKRGCGNAARLGTASEPNSGACLQRERQPNMLNPAARKSCLGPSRASLEPRFAAATLQPACEARSEAILLQYSRDVV